MVKYKIKKGDTVKVISGKDKAAGKTGNVLDVDKKKGRVLVEGVNLYKKTFRKSKENPNGGIKEVENYLNLSNVMLVCPKCKKPTRVGYNINDKGEKNRICKKCKASID
jgi:large subunit ribosomal protein L24